MAEENIDFEINCPVCQEEFGDADLFPIILPCGHTICQSCVRGITAQSSRVRSCPTCRVSWVSNALKKNYKLNEAVSLIKKLRERNVDVLPQNPVTCTTCAKVDGEALMFVCRNCIHETLKYDVLRKVIPTTELDAKTFALCGSCAIYHHVSRGHTTLAFFPIFSSLQFPSLLSSVNLLREEFNEHVKKMEKMYKQFGLSVSKFHNELDRMNELMRKSKTTSIQQEFVSRIADEIGEMSAQILFVNNTFERGATQFSEKCKQLTVKNDKDEKEKCRDVVAERVTAKRGERRGKTHLDITESEKMQEEISLIYLENGDGKRQKNKTDKFENKEEPTCKDFCFLLILLLIIATILYLKIIQ